MPEAIASQGPTTSNLADILERVLDKGIVIAGDIKIDLLDIELLTIRLRLFVASVETARKAGIDWWETDPALSTRAARDEMEQENRMLRERLEALESGDRDRERESAGERNRDREPAGERNRGRKTAGQRGTSGAGA
ncbi:gas vesicle protein [Streptomyces physcomitrii]|uniref:Gas vesicle protein n=1 Tax=Streptomyces physcomitrii TaxID=2724184 RepID=A0ABX1H2L5_9ACTN|nr:gas vesicle protein [Streptomyces physcomitrii]NKI42307.1 gas vesicle protein [Streptomyces physcomitrii]